MLRALVFASALVPLSGQVLRVGGPIQLSGTFATYGTNAQVAFQMWKEWVEAESRGYTVSLDFRDAPDTDTAVSLTIDMVDNDLVDVLVTPYTSGASTAVLAAAENFTGPVLIWGGASSGIFTQDVRAPNAFGFFTPASEYMDTGLQALSSMGAKTVVLYQNSKSFSASVCEGAKAYAESHGYTVKGSITVENDGSNVAAKLAELSGVSAEVLVGCGHSTDMKVLIKELASSDFTPRAVLATQVASPSFRSQMTEYEGLLVDLLMPDQWVDVGSNNDSVVGWTPDGFTSAFQAKQGSVPTYHTASAGASCVALANAINMAGGISNMTAVSEKLQQMDIQSFYGNIKFTAQGEMSGKGMYTIQNRPDGSSPVVAPPSYVQSPLVFRLSTIRVGGPIQMTGTYADIGNNAVKAFQLWKDLMAGKGVGYGIELDFRNATTKEEAVSIALDMIHEVDVMVTPYTSGMTIEVVAALNATNKPIMVWGGASSDIFTQSPRAQHVFGVLTPAYRYMETGLTVLWDQGASKVLITKNSKLSSEAVCTGAKVYAEFLGMTVEEALLADNGSDAKTILEALSAEAKSPDILVGCGHLDFVKALIENLEGAGVKPKSILSTQVATGGFKEALKADGKEELLCGLLMPTQWDKNAQTGTDDVTKWTSDSFGSQFQQSTGEAPSYQTAGAAAVGVALSNAIDGAGGVADLHLIITKLNALDIESFFGNIKFASDGQMTGKGMWTVQNQRDGDSIIVAPDADIFDKVNYGDTCPEDKKPTPAPAPEPEGGFPGWLMILLVLGGLILVGLCVVGGIMAFQGQQGQQGGEEGAATELT